MTSEKSAYSRRSVMTGIAGAVPIAAIGAVPAVAATVAHPDAELIALGREIEAFLPRYVIVSLESCVRGWRAHDLACERSGFDPRADHRAESLEEVAVRNAAFDRWMKAHVEAETEMGLDRLNAEYSRLSHEENRLTKAVRALKATTPEGVRVKALAVALANIHEIAHPRDTLDYTEELARDLCEAVLAELDIEVPAHLIDAVWATS